MAWWVLAIQEGDHFSWVATGNPLRTMALGRFASGVLASARPRVLYYEEAEERKFARRRARLLMDLPPDVQLLRIQEINPKLLDLSVRLKYLIRSDPDLFESFVPSESGDGGDDGLAGVGARLKPVPPRQVAGNPWPK